LTNINFYGFVSRLLLCLLLAVAEVITVAAQQTDDTTAAGSADQVDLELKQAARLYSNREFAAAAVIYQRLSESANADQAAWALELYGVCLEQQGDHANALAIYESWLQRYPGTAGEVRVQQRRAALLTASAEPQAARKLASRQDRNTAIYGSTSLMYRGLRRKIQDQDADTPISSLAGDLDLHMRARSGSFSWRSRVSGGYLSDQSDRDDSDGRVSNLYVGVMHEPSGMELTLGRQRASENGIYGYFDGASLSFPAGGLATLTLMGGAVTTSSQDAPSSDHQVYSLGTEFDLSNPGLRLGLYAMEQTYDGLTERRAVGGEISYFNDFSHYLLVADYDIKFKETNNVMFNGSWGFGDATNLALSLGYQRSPFLSASNAMIGEYDVNLDQLVKGLGDGIDVYDAALDKTALSRYGSLVVNRQVSDKLRVLGEVFYYELSDLPQYDPAYDTPDSDANTTWGLQLVWNNALFSNDVLSTGARYTSGDVTSNATVFVDEKMRLDHGLDLIMRLSASSRWLEGLNQDAYTLRPGIRLDWYITPDFLLDMELGYEWLMQDFESEDFEVHQGFLIMGLRKRF
jgi:tetratricopeptide (TPR) repeat protein